MSAMWRDDDPALNRGRIVRTWLRAAAGVADLSAVPAQRCVRCQAPDAELICRGKGNTNETRIVADHADHADLLRVRAGIIPPILDLQRIR